VRRGSIGGLELTTLTTQLADQYGLRDTRGALVLRMARASSAYEAGLRPGDVIVAFNGQTIDDTGLLLRLIADATIGTTATISVSRDGRRTDLRVPIVATASRRQRTQ